jgi:hypothetical protein
LSESGLAAPIHCFLRFFHAGGRHSVFFSPSPGDSRATFRSEQVANGPLGRSFARNRINRSPNPSSAPGAVGNPAFFPGHSSPRRTERGYGRRALSAARANGRGAWIVSTCALLAQPQRLLSATKPQAAEYPTRFDTVKVPKSTRNTGKHRKKRPSHPHLEKSAHQSVILSP